jgi:hypothetical protein
MVRVPAKPKNVSAVTSSPTNAIRVSTKITQVNNSNFDSFNLEHSELRADKKVMNSYFDYLTNCANPFTPTTISTAMAARTPNHRVPSHTICVARRPQNLTSAFAAFASPALVGMAAT